MPIKKAFRLIVVFCVLPAMGVQYSFAQCTPSLSSCTLKLPTDPLCMVPDTNEMPPGFVDIPYDRSIHFIFESSITVYANPQTGDSLPFPVTATMEYMVFDSIGGLPPGITYEMYSGNPLDPYGKFSPANGNKAFGCIYLHGTPTQPNTHSTSGATIYTKPHGCVLGGTLCGDFPWPIVYRVPIELPEAVNNPQALNDLQIIPLMSSKKLQVDFKTPAGCVSTLQITDLTGKTIFSNSIHFIQGQNQTVIDFSNAPGVYILRMTTPYGLRTQRFAW